MPFNLEFSRKNIIQNVAVLFSGSVLAQGMTALVLLLTARQLGATGYGQYASCYILVSFTSILFSLGLDLWLLRNAGRTPDELARLTGSVLAIKGGIGAVWFGLFIGLASVINSSRFPLEILRFSALAILLDGLFSTNLTAFRATLRNKISAPLEVGTVGIWLMATLLLIARGQTQPLIYLGVRIGALLIGLVVSTLLVWTKVEPKISLAVIKRALREAWPFAGSDLLVMATMRQDVLIVALMLGDKAAGLYSPAVGIINAAFLLPGAIYLVVTPVLSNLFIKDIKGAWITARKSILFSALAGLAEAVGLALIVGPVISLLGVSFRGSRDVLLILSIILFTHSIAFGMASIVVASGLQAKRTLVQIVVVAINAILDFAIVQHTGILGVAVVYVVSDTLLMLGYTWLVWHYRKVGTIPSQ
jgi:O-antigen/teichoic acid export membrane protein